MPFLTPERARFSDPKPRIKSPTHSQSSLKKTNNIFNILYTKFSNNNNNDNNNNKNDSKESEKLLMKTPTKKKSKKFSLATLKGLGCRDSMSVLAPVVIRSAADLEAEKARRRRRKKKKAKKRRRPTTSANPSNPAVVVVDLPDVCCAPGIGIASDVVPRSRVHSERATHKLRPARRTATTERVSASGFPSAYGTAYARSNASEERELHRFRRHSPESLPQIAMFQYDLLTARSLDGYDQYRNWRLDVDSMSYEELLDLGDRIGYVGTGLQEDEIIRCLRKTSHSGFKSLPLLVSTDRNWKCSICQEGWRGGDKMGRLECGHHHHLHCIKKWLLQKNACPVCQAAAMAGK